MGGAPICLVGVVGFATVAIGVGPFVYSICLSNSALHLAQVQFIEILVIRSPQVSSN